MSMIPSSDWYSNRNLFLEPLKTGEEYKHVGWSMAEIERLTMVYVLRVVVTVTSVIRTLINQRRVHVW